MTDLIESTSIRSQGVGVPSHTAPAGMLYLMTDTNRIFIQIQTPTGSWRQVRGRLVIVSFGKLVVIHASVNRDKVV